MNPSQQEVRASIIEFLVKEGKIPAEHLSDDAVLGDLDIDSLSAVEMLWTVEHTYGVRLPDPEQGLFSLTIGDLVSRFAALLSAPAGGQPAGAQ